MAFFAEGRKQGSFDSGIQTAIMAVLSNPKFLYRFETAPANLPVGTVYALDDLAIASRLAFFLWSEGPDEELLSLAAGGRLKDAAVLDQQVQRMLADPRSSTLVSNFAYQWLNLAALKDVDADPALFPWFDEDLRRSYLREVELFVDSVLRADRSVVDLLTADYSFLNERLALQYRVPNVRGSQFRRVTLPDSARYGLAGQGRHPDADVLRQSHGASAARCLRARAHHRHAAQGATARRRSTARAGPGRQGHDGSRAARIASHQRFMQCLPWSHGSTGFRAGEFRCRGHLAQSGSRSTRAG